MFADSIANALTAAMEAAATIMSFFIFTYFLGTRSD